MSVATVARPPLASPSPLSHETARGSPPTRRYAIGARYDTSTADGWWRVMALIGLVPAIAFAIGAS